MRFKISRQSAVIAAVLFVVIVCAVALQRGRLEKPGVTGAVGIFSANNQDPRLAAGDTGGESPWQSLGRSNPLAGTPEGTVTSGFAEGLFDSGLIGSLMKGESPGELPDSYAKDVTNYYTSLEGQKLNAALGSLHYSSDVSPNAVKTYFNQVAAIYLKNFSSITKSDLEIVSEVSESGSFSKLSQLDPVITGTQKSITEYQALAAPTSVKSFHEHGMRILIKTEFELEALRALDKDPTLGLFAAQNRVATKLEFSKMYFVEIAEYLKRQSIIFGGGSPGNQLFGWQ